MKNSKKISILGGDLRQLYAAEKLALRYDNISLWGIKDSYRKENGKIHFSSDLSEAVCDATIVLPLPSTTDGTTLNCPLFDKTERPKLSEITSVIPSGSLVIGGKLCDAFVRSAENKDIRTVDYFKSEFFQIKNAYTTAEAALSIAMNALDRNIRGAEIAVMGFGRIAKHLCSLLLSMGAEVTVAARKEEDLAWARSYGFKALQINGSRAWLEALSHGYDVIYNTVPCWLLDREFLVAADKKTFIVDLASAPGGVDICAAKELGANVSWATSLPGKYAPSSAGELIAECIIEIIDGEGEA